MLLVCKHATDLDHIEVDILGRWIDLDLVVAVSTLHKNPCALCPALLASVDPGHCRMN